MVQITQTDEDIKIIIELNRLITRKPDIVLLPTYIKFNNPPIFFERHLAGEIDEISSFCRIFKTEARIVLVKKQKGIWPELFRTFSKEELMQKRIEIADQIVERNKERDKQAIERFDNKRRVEINKEIRRETAIRERVAEFQKSSCREIVSGTQSMQKPPENSKTIKGGVVGISLSGTSAPPSGRVSTPAAPLRSAAPLSAVRKSGKISVSFSNYAFATPKRESQEGIQRPFKIEDACDMNAKAEASVQE